MRIVEPAARQFGVEEGVEARTRRDDAAPAFVLAARVVGRLHIERKPLPAHRRAAARLRRMRRDERRVGQQRSPLSAKFDQIIAVGAVAVEEDHQLAREQP